MTAPPAVGPASARLLMRPATTDDTPAICALLGEVFDDNPKADPAVYAWQYTDNPFGPPMSWVAVDPDGRTVAHAGLFMTPGRIHGTPCLLGHAGDAVTHPDWQGQGVYAELSRRRLATADDSSLAATICIPNDGSRSAAIRSGLHLRHHLRAYVRPALSRDRTTGVPAACGDVAPLTGSPTELGDLVWEHDPGRHGVLRSAEWLAWRYAAHPTRQFDQVGWSGPRGLKALVVTSLVSRGGRRWRYVMDLLASSATAAVAALRACAAGMGDSGFGRDGDDRPVSGTVVLAVPRSTSATAALRAGYLPLPHRLDPQSQFLGLSGGSLGRDGQWEVSWGDHDHI